MSAASCETTLSQHPASKEKEEAKAPPVVPKQQARCDEAEGEHFISLLRITPYILSNLPFSSTIPAGHMASPGIAPAARCTVSCCFFPHCRVFHFVFLLLPRVAALGHFWHLQTHAEGWLWLVSRANQCLGMRQRAECGAGQGLRSDGVTSCLPPPYCVHSHVHPTR